jgi:hypothetical protein
MWPYVLMAAKMKIVKIASGVLSTGSHLVELNSTDLVCASLEKRIHI